MKFFIVFGILCLVALSIQVSVFEDCDEKTISWFKKESCMHVLCKSFKNQTVSMTGVYPTVCSYPRCEDGKKLKGKIPMDVTKVYPDCCPTVVCE